MICNSIDSDRNLSGKITVFKDLKVCHGKGDSLDLSTSIAKDPDAGKD